MIIKSEKSDKQDKKRIKNNMIKQYTDKYNNEIPEYYMELEKIFPEIERKLKGFYQ